MRAVSTFFDGRGSARPRAAVFWVVLAAAAGPQESHAQEREPLAASIRPSDWGLGDLDGMRFGLFSAIYTEDPRLEAYRILDREPRFELVVRGETPPLEGGTLLVHGAGDGNRNRLDGYFNGFAGAPSRAEASLARASDGLRAIRLTFERAAEGFCGMWVHLFDFGTRPDRRLYLDATPFTVLTFQVRGGTGHEEVLLKVADAEWEAKEDAIAVGRLADFLPEGRITAGWQRALIPLERLPFSLDRRALASLIFEGISQGAGTLYVREIAFHVAATDWAGDGPTGYGPRPPGTADSSPSELSKAVWVWNTTRLLAEEERREELADLVAGEGFDRVFLQLPGLAGETGVPAPPKWDDGQLASLVTRLRQAGARVSALGGFRRYAERDHHPLVLSILDRMLEYNRSAAPDARFAGVHHDIEPYLIPGFHGVRRDSILTAYLDLVEEVARRVGAEGLTYSLDIPFWYDQPDEDTYEPVLVDYGGETKPVSHHLIDRVDEIVIMDYRTVAYGADGTVRHGRGELEYASKLGKSVLIGLETGPLPDEDLLYVRGESSSGPLPGPGDYLVVERLGPDTARVTWTRATHAGAAPPPGAIWWPIRRIVPVPADKITFADLGLARLKRVMDETAAEFADTPAFRGFAIHYDESYADLVRCGQSVACARPGSSP